MIASDEGLRSKKWYRREWFLWLTFLFCTPIWAIIVLTDPKQTMGVKILAVILLAGSMLLICPSLTRQIILSIATPASSQVTYRVTGSIQHATVVYWTADGMEQRSVKLPWQKTFEAQGHQIISIVAQHDGDSGRIQCEILMDGKVAKKATSEGPYAGVTCGP